MRRIILLGGGIDSIGIIERANDMGLLTTVVDWDPSAPGLDLADAVLLVSCYDVEQVLGALRRRPNHTYDAVLCAGTDAPYVMAAVAEEYGLVGPSRRTAMLSMNKYEQKKVLSTAGVLVPKYALWDNVQELSLPIVLKPTKNRGARGVVRVTRPSMLGHCHAVAENHSPDGLVLAEEWINGTQLSAEGLVQDGEVIWTAAVERNYDRLDEFGPFVIEDGGDAPPDLIGSYANDWKLGVYRALQDSAKALGLQTGTIKGDLVWDGACMWTIEVAARLSGGRLCSHIIPEVWGVDFVGYAIKLALGETVDRDEIRPTVPKYACQRFCFPVFPTCHPERGKSVIGYGWSRLAAQEEAKKLLLAEKE